ncbi:unnamed protein product [Toxocara canis]|uniref:Uncharacterized protein n=1 Tax=Toxocara canis TaxID=6265 RepID=A0A183U9C6_TOXCA|nr:unnamed protein product [Toxocara canis]
MATSEPPVSNAEAEAFEEELVLEMEQVVTEEELMQGLEQEENVATQNEHMEEIVVEHEEEHDGDQHDGVRYQQSNQSHPSMDAHYEEVPATTTYEPGRPVTKQKEVVSINLSPSTYVLIYDYFQAAYSDYFLLPL